MAIILGSCSDANKILVRLWTNKPEFTLYAEIYNRSQQKYKMEVFYIEKPYYELKESSSVPDLVAADYLSGKTSVTYFKPIDELFYDEKKNPEGIKAGFIYDGLLINCRTGPSTTLLPVSFNLPALIHRKNENQSFSLSLDEIADVCADFNEINGDSAQHIGFSPTWPGGSVLYFINLSGFYFNENGSEALFWDAEKLDSAIKDIIDWEDKINGPINAVTYFNSRYYNAPAYKLIAENRILYDFISLRDFYAIPSEKRSGLDLTWIGRDDKIPVTEDVVYIGVHKQTLNEKGAKDFLRWFYKTGNQATIIKESQMNRQRGFGILGGLSSIKELNEAYIHELYPDLVGKIPAEQNLVFPQPLPPQWPEIKSDVILPWLYNSLMRAPDQKGLKETLHTWQIQHIE